MNTQSSEREFPFPLWPLGSGHNDLPIGQILGGFVHMKNAKQAIALASAAALSLSMLAGCGSSNTPAQSGGKKPLLRRFCL